ncbi:hypothetical protein DXX93_10310 [Thalassotalea euphylliae]|uniref:Uncharacterized protein n=1 Tax=Thalassotalea euphylliae TaxID=1655234 RepID=A0A3E0TSG8_9GAMM|nr:hypothetical protein [Thalassotalea euphylliae]REL26922.1 hypothetical protein DXX93_10310 [Thalassotalea euphylliae]
MKFHTPENRSYNALLKSMVDVGYYVVPITFVFAVISYVTAGDLQTFSNDVIKEHVAFLSAFIAVSCTVICYGASLMLLNEKRVLHKATAYFAKLSIILLSALYFTAVSVSFVHSVATWSLEGLAIFIPVTALCFAVIFFTHGMAKNLYEGNAFDKISGRNQRAFGAGFFCIGLIMLGLTILQQLDALL